MIVLLMSNFFAFQIPSTRRLKVMCLLIVLLSCSSTYLLYAQKSHQPIPRQAHKITLAHLNTYTFIPTHAPDSESDETKESLSFAQFLQKRQKKLSLDEATITINLTDGAPIHTHIIPGIAHDNALSERVTLYSRGFWAPNLTAFLQGETPPTGGIKNTYSRIKNRIIHGPCISFDRPETRSYFSFGQHFDLKCFDTVYQAIRTAHPTTRITLASSCLGSLIGLRYIAQNPERAAAIDTIVLSSPLSSTRDFFDRTPCAVQEFVYTKTGITLPESMMRSILQSGTCWWYYRFNLQVDTLNTDAIRGKNIFITHRLGDFLISDVSVTRLVKNLRVHNKVYFVPLTDQDFVTKVPIHCRLSPSPTFQKAVNAFYREHGLPHDEHLAAEGLEYLQTALFAE